MKAYECEIHDMVTLNAVRCRVKSIQEETVTMFNFTTQADEVVSKLHYVVLVERPRKHYPKGHEFRVYKWDVAKKNRRVIIGRGLTYPEAEALMDEQPRDGSTRYMVVNGKIKPNQQ
jgi:hypothetical protein